MTIEKKTQPSDALLMDAIGTVANDMRPSLSIVRRPDDNTKGVDLYTMAIDMLDQAFIQFYNHVRQNSRRLTHLLITLLPLATLLVGSCKTAQLPTGYGSSTRSEQFRMALFPDRANFQDASYSPAAGYVSQARAYIVGQPQDLTKLTRQEIGYLFGKPAFHRHDASAEVWQYKAGTCVVDFYFYNDKATYGQPLLSYADVRMKGELVQGSAARTTPVSASEQSDCLRDVVAGGFSI